MPPSVYLGPMSLLKRSSDRKTANLATPNGKQAKINNAFGLPSGTAFSCPGATPTCERVCYAGKLERLFPGMRASMLHNWEIMRDASFGTMVSLLSEVISDFRADCVKWDAPMEFRIHHDGDFFSRDYAHAWATVVRLNPDIQFWVYTRSFTPGINVTDLIADIPNLAVYLSVDSHNSGHANVIRDEYPSVRFATLAQTASDAAADMVVLTGRPGGICPENVKRIPLISAEGGACHSCGLCIKGKSDIRFSISKG